MLAFALVRIGRALDRQVGGFGAIRSEEDFLLAVGTDQCGHLLAGSLQSIPDPKAMLVE
jgi:hypothetical protein